MSPRKSGANGTASTPVDPMAELLRVVTARPEASAAIVEEAADVVIVLYRLASICSEDLLAAVDRKMATNRAREWKLDQSGHGYHVRDK